MQRRLEEARARLKARIPPPPDDERVTTSHRLLGALQPVERVPFAAMSAGVTAVPLVGRAPSRCADAEGARSPAHDAAHRRSPRWSRRLVGARRRLPPAVVRPARRPTRRDRRRRRSVVNARRVRRRCSFVGSAGIWGKRLVRPIASPGCARAARRPSASARATLRQPLRARRSTRSCWVVARAALRRHQPRRLGRRAGVHIASVIFLGGLTCTALGYLLVERIMRPVTARALAFGPPSRPCGPGREGAARARLAVRDRRAAGRAHARSAATR